MMKDGFLALFFFYFGPHLFGAHNYYTGMVFGKGRANRLFSF